MEKDKKKDNNGESLNKLLQIIKKNNNDKDIKIKINNIEKRIKNGMENNTLEK